MTTNRDLSQKIKELKTKLSDTLEEIEALEIEQSLIENERLLDLDEKVKEIVEQMKTRFKMYDPSNDIKVKARLFDRVIEIVSKRHKIAFCIYRYEDRSLEEIEKWAVEQIESVQFYQKISSSFDRSDILTATMFDRFSIRINDTIEIFPVYNSYRQLVTLEIQTLFSSKDIEHKLNEDSNEEIEFSNISTVDENEYIFKSIETRTCLLDEMVDQIKAIKAEKLGTADQN